MSLESLLPVITALGDCQTSAPSFVVMLLTDPAYESLGKRMGMGNPCGP